MIYFSLKIYRATYSRFCFPSKHSKPHVEYIAGSEGEQSRVVEMKSVDVKGVEHQTLENKKKEETAVAHASPVIEKKFNF